MEEFENLLKSLETAITEKYDKKLESLKQDRQADLDSVEYFRSLEEYAKIHNMKRYETDLKGSKEILKALFPDRTVGEYGWIEGVSRWSGPNYMNSVNIAQSHGLVMEDGYIDKETEKVVLIINYRLPGSKSKEKYFYYY